MGMVNGRALLCVGTRDGLYLYESDRTRTVWRRRGPFLAGCDVSALAVDAHGRILAGTKQHGLHRSADGGATWTELPLDRLGPALHAHYAGYNGGMEPNPTDENSIWEIQTVETDPNRLYVGVMPAALFTSGDGGESWSEVSALRALPQSKEFWGPFGAAFLHSIDVVHNGREDESTPALAVAISVGGVLRSYDNGATWKISNNGMEPWKPDGAQFDDIHQDIHRMVVAPANRRRVYCTVHIPAILRSDDGGGVWQTLPLAGEEGATRPIAVHPRNPDRLWITPLDDMRPDGVPTIGDRLRALESQDGGQTFQDWSAGLGDGKCLVYRHGLTADEDAERAAVYLGTSQGRLFQRFEDGASWTAIDESIPSVRAVHVWQA